MFYQGKLERKNFKNFYSMFPSLKVTPQSNGGLHTVSTCDKESLCLPQNILPLRVSQLKIVLYNVYILDLNIAQNLIKKLNDRTLIVIEFLMIKF